MEDSEWTPVTIEAAELGEMIVKFSFATREEYEAWWIGDGGYELPRFGMEMLGDDF